MGELPVSSGEVLFLGLLSESSEGLMWFQMEGTESLCWRVRAVPICGHSSETCCQRPWGWGSQDRCPFSSREAPLCDVTWELGGP